MANTFPPTIGWYLKVLAILLMFCVAAFFTLSFAVKKLPTPYQPHQPSAEITPWLS